MHKKIDNKLLKSLEPLSRLTLDEIEELARKSRIEKLPADRIIFKQGERNKRLHYILSGQVELSVQGQKKKQLIKGKTDQARYPLAEETPRPVTAKTRTDVTLLSIDQDLLEIISSDTTQQGAIEVTEISEEIDGNSWMLKFLQSPAFLHLPTENIQTLLMKLEEKSYSKGQAVVKQGEESDNYYIVKTGRCGVSRIAAPGADEIKLAILNNGDGFGEEALITGSKRNATVTMLDDGELMQLNKQDFLELLIRPLINYYNEQEVMKNLALGSLVMDVRSHEAYTASHINGSINIPLSLLRSKAPGLNPERDYIICCDDGTQSEAAAFLLIQQGFNCHVLKGGLKSTQIKSAVPAANVTHIETSKTRQADENRNLAVARATRLKQETEKARMQASELEKKKLAAEQARVSAQQKVAHLKKSTDTKAETTLKNAQQQIQQEMQRAQKAEHELKQLVSEQSKNAQHHADLQSSLQQAEKMAQESARVASEVHKQAERDAQLIRQQAEQEAKKLRAEMEAELQQHKQVIEQSRLNEAMQQQAVAKEAEALRARVEQTRQQIEQSMADVEARSQQHRQELIDEAQREAARLAQQTTQQAELEAEQIRLKAIEEAESLRAEMEAAKQLVEQEAEKVRQKKQYESALKAQAEQEKQLRQRQHEEQQKRQQQQLAQQAEERKRADARKRAEAIKARLEASAQAKQQHQHNYTAEGMAVTDFRFKESDEKIVLESHEDIFVFKKPVVSSTAKEVLLREASSHKAEKTDNELPSFEVESDAPMLPPQIPVLSQAVEPQTLLHTSKTSEKRNRAFALAAVMLLAISIGGVTYVKTDGFKQDVASSLTGNKSAASLFGSSSSSSPEKTIAEKKVNHEAEKEFETLLKKWKKSVNKN